MIIDNDNQGAHWAGWMACGIPAATLLVAAANGAALNLLEFARQA